MSAAYATKEKALRIGPIAVGWALWAVLSPLLSAGALAAIAILPEPDAFWGVPATLMAIGLFALLLAARLLQRTARVDLGAAGRGRLFFGGLVTALRALALIAFAALLWIALEDPGFVQLGALVGVVGADTAYASTMSSIETVAIAQGTWAVVQAFVWIAIGASVLELLVAITAWFLIAPHVRRTFWLMFDAPVTAAFVFALWTLPFRPPEEGEDPTLPATALGIATLFGLRAFVRSLPYALDVIERLSFQAFVAARMLRAKKSGFLTVIGLLSILAVSFSSCTLTTTLSVMGGFRDDLQQKILGNNAHVVVDREYGTFEGWGPALERVRGVHGVLGASPFVAGEVMVTSASNLGGAVLRGIDPAHIGEVTDLPENMRHGRLEYLDDPEQLLHLSSDEMTGSLLGGSSRRAADEVPEIETENEAAPHEPAPDEPASHEPAPHEPAPHEPAPEAAPHEPAPHEAAPHEAAPEAAPHAAAPQEAAPSGARREAVPHEASHDSLMRDIDRVLRELDAEQAGRRQHGGAGLAGPHVAIDDPFADPFADPDGDRGAGGGSALDELFLETPRPLQRAREVLPGLIVGQELARSLRLHVGDEVNVVSPIGDLGPAGPIPRSRPFRIAGIFYSGMYEYDMQVAYTDLATAQRFLGTGGGVTGIEIKVEDWERAEHAAGEIRSALARPELRVRSWQEVNRNLFGALQLEKLAMFITLGIAILVASFCIVGTLVLMVQEKGREVGILKAMGAEGSQIVGVFMLQGLLIGLVGAVSGLGLGWVLCFTFEHYPIVTLDPEVYYIDRLPIHTEPIEFVSVGIAAVLVCLLATIYPAILGSRLRPVDALRYS